MIRVTVELLPHGTETGKRTLGVLLIANEGTGSEDIGNYEGSLLAEYTVHGPRTAWVTGFARKKQSVWTLVGMFLKKFGHVQ
jgi:hypothetical protein